MRRPFVFDRISPLGRGAGGEGPLPGTGYELWAWLGQSNNVMWTQNTTSRVFPSGALQIARVGGVAGNLVDNALVAAAHPVDAVPITLRNNAFHMADKFTADYLADPANSGKTPVYLFGAEGGTSIADGQTWAPIPTVGTRLADARDRINTFFTNYPGATMGGFLWHQGESTALATYIEPFERMRAYLIANCPRVLATTPWVVGGRAGGTQTLAFAAQQNFPDTFKYFAFADSAGTTAAADGLHFSDLTVDNSVDLMGERYYDGVALARANSDVDLGYNDPFGYQDFTAGSWSAQGTVVTSITDGNNIQMNAAANPRRAWQVIPAAIFRSYTSYRVRFTAERDDATDTINFGVGANANLNSFKTQSLAIAANTPTDYDITFNTVGTAFTNGIFFGVISNAGPTLTNVKLTDIRVTRTIEE